MTAIRTRFTKWVILFESTSQAGAVHQKVFGPVYNAARSIVDQRLVDIGEVNLVTRRSQRVQKVYISVPGPTPLWLFYPKIMIIGDTGRTWEELAAEFDAVKTQFQDSIRVGLTSIPVSATSIEWIIKLSTGEVIEAG